jgi:tRNA G18 (ribose-2'-O)-methylase SpoU
MARLVEIADPADPRVADYVKLRDVHLRRSLEAEHGLFLAEGGKLVRRAVEAGFPVRSFLLAPRWLAALQDVLDRVPDAPCYVAGEAVIEALTGFHVHRGALASLRRPAPRRRRGRCRSVARTRPGGPDRPHQRGCEYVNM